MDWLAKVAIYALECIFALGVIGSAIVVILTSIEDSEVFFSRKDELPPTAHSMEPLTAEPHKS